MITSFARLFAAVLLLASVAACAGGEGPVWTYSPLPSAEPSASPSAEPSASPSAEPSPSGAPSAEPSPSGVPSAAPSPGPTGVSPSPPGEARVIELEMTGTLQILRDGEQVKDIPVTIGETILFRVTNTAGYAHNLYIGPEELLASNQVSGLPGIPDFTEGTREFEWLVPEDVTSLKFGCTVPGHYQLMNGTFSLQ
jgi:hypothetical protein